MVYCIALTGLYVNKFKQALCVVGSAVGFMCGWPISISAKISIINLHRLRV
jgi:hypothetical protein